MEEVEEAGIVQHQPSRQNFFALLHSREVGGASRRKMAQGSPQKFTRSVRGRFVSRAVSDDWSHRIAPALLHAPNRASVAACIELR